MKALSNFGRWSASLGARLTVAAGLTAAAVLMPMGSASAHVTAQPGTAEKGGYAVVTFRVPNESDEASTVKLSVSLPEEHPFTSVRTTTVDGWTAEVTMRELDEPIESHGHEVTEVASSVTWTATKDAGIAPGTYLDFPLSLGAMPEDADVIYFPAEQTYDDGEVVNWDEIPEGDAEPERPAPAVALEAGDGGHHGGPADEVTAGPSATATADQSDSLARWLGGGGLLLGGLAAGIAIGAVRRREA